MTYQPYQCADDLCVQILPGTEQEVRYIYQEIFTSLDYQQAGIKLNNDATVLDIGANIGLFSLYLIRQFTKLRLIAIEPVTEIYTALEQNIANSQQQEQDITVLNKGVADRIGQSIIHFYPNIPANSTIYPDQKQNEFSQLQTLINANTVRRYNPYLVPVYYCAYPFVQLLKPFIKRMMLNRLKRVVKQTCQITTVSSLIGQYKLDNIDLLKIDAEGCEYDILKGISVEHWPRIKQLAIEVSSLMCSNNLINIKKLLIEKDYDVRIKGISSKNELAMVYAIQK